VVSLHRELLRTSPEYVEAVETLAEKGVWSAGRDGGDRRWRIGDRKNASSVMTAVYHVRCNLFHGQKHPDSHRDQRLVKAAYEILIRIMNPYVDDPCLDLP
jgi:hypothetical protein